MSGRAWEPVRAVDIPPPAGVDPHAFADQAGDKEQLAEILRLLSRVQPPQKSSVVPNTGQRGLTKREREIIRLVMTGMSNVEVAERLYVSIRTVEGHLYRAFDKLGVSSRGELAHHHLD